MNRINWIFTLSSISVLLVTVERFSFTTKVLLQPYNFLRLHELVQMTTLILLTAIIPFLLIKEITNNFETLKLKKGFLFFLVFLIGVYFYATGNGVHEIGSFYFNNHCDTQNFKSAICKSFFFNDYYTGNIFFFAGGGMMIISLLLFEKIRPYSNFGKKDMTVMLINSVIYAFAIFAYAAFDRVLIGLIYSIVIAIISAVLFFSIKNKYLKYPITTYTTITYTLGTLAALLIRIF